MGSKKKEKYLCIQPKLKSIGYLGGKLQNNILPEGGRVL